MFTYFFVVDESIVSESLEQKLKGPLSPGGHLRLTHEEFKQFRDGVLAVPLPAVARHVKGARTLPTGVS